MARRADHTREELKYLILKTASEIIAIEGFSELTARKLAQKIGYTPGTLYNIFSSMDELYLHVSVQTLHKLYDALCGAACNDPSKTTLENLKAMAFVYRNFAHEHRNHWLMLFNGDLPERRHQIEWYYQEIDRLFEPLQRLLTPLFPPNRAQQQKIAARTLFSAVHGICFLQETGRVSLIGPHTNENEMTDYLITCFVNGIIMGNER